MDALSDFTTRRRSSENVAVGPVQVVVPIKKLRELKQIAEDAEAERDRVLARRSTVTLDAAKDWDRLSHEARRELVKLVVDRVVVSPGRGPGRVRVELIGQ